MVQRHTKLPIPPISRGPGRTKAIYTEEKTNALRQELFQPPPNLLNITPIDPTHNHPNNIPWHPITKEETCKAIFNPHTTKAPGLSQINYQILRWAWNAN
jgi:hypothetical protein